MTGKIGRKKVLKFRDFPARYHEVFFFKNVIAMIIPFISVLVGISLMYYIRQRKAEKEMDEIVSSLPSVNKEHSLLSARDLCLDLLRQLNCEVELEGDDIYFTYQNENFMIEASNECHFIVVWDLCWYMKSLENQEEVELVKEAVNRVNSISSNIVLYYEDKEANTLNVASKSYHLLIPDIPNSKAYLSAIFSNFFETKQS